MDRPTLIFLPGLMCDVSVWTAQIEAFAAQGYRTIVPDFLGLDSLETMARRALALCNGKIALLGHSMGGRVALEAWALEPQRIDRLVLLDTGAHPTRASEFEVRQALVDLAYTSGMGAVASQWLPPMIAKERWADEDLTAPLVAMIERATADQFAGQQRALLNRPDRMALLPTIDVPVLLIAGRHDGHSSPEQHAALAALIPDATLRIVEHAGHMVTVEQPEAVNHFLLEWFAREDPRSVE